METASLPWRQRLPGLFHEGAASLHGLCQQLSVRQDRAAPGRPRLRLSSCLVGVLVLLNAGKKTQKYTSFAHKLQQKDRGIRKDGMTSQFLGTDFHRGDWSRSRKEFVTDCLYHLQNSIWHFLLICQIHACTVCQMQLLVNFLKRNLMLT